MVLEKAGEDRLAVLAAIVAVADRVLQVLQRLVLAVRQVVQRTDDVHLPDERVIEIVLEEVDDREAAERAGAVLAMDRLQIDGVHGVVAPGAGQHRFRGDIAAADDVADIVLDREVVERAEEGVVLGHVLVGDAGAQVGRLQVAHDFPIDDMCVQVVIAVLDDALNVVDGQFAVPARVHVHDQRAQVIFLDLQGQVRTVDATAQADDAVIFMIAPFGPDGVDAFLEQLRAVLIGVPELRRGGVEGGAVGTHALVVERNERIGSVHDTAIADPIVGIWHVFMGRRRGG